MHVLDTLRIRLAPHPIGCAKAGSRMLCALRLATGERGFECCAVLGAAVLMRQLLETVIHALQRRSIDLLAACRLAGFGGRRRPGIALAALRALTLTDQVPKFCVLRA